MVFFCKELYMDMEVLIWNQVSYFFFKCMYVFLDSYIVSIQEMIMGDEREKEIYFFFFEG